MSVLNSEYLNVAMERSLLNDIKRLAKQGLKSKRNAYGRSPYMLIIERIQEYENIIEGVRIGGDGKKKEYNRVITIDNDKEA